MERNDKRELQERIRDFQRRVAKLRTRYDSALSAGSFPEDLEGELSLLLSERTALVAEALPQIRRRFFFRKDIGARCEVLVTPKDATGPLAGDLTEDVLQEAGLSEETLRLVRTLVFGEAEPLKPPEALLAVLEPLGISPYLAAGTGDFCFLFDEEGSVFLAEDNGGWMVRRGPLFTGILAENAISESGRSVLVLDADHRVLRLSYARLETPAEAERVSLYG